MIRYAEDIKILTKIPIMPFNIQIIKPYI